GKVDGVTMTARSGVRMAPPFPPPPAAPPPPVPPVAWLSRNVLWLTLIEAGAPVCAGASGTPSLWMAGAFPLPPATPAYPAPPKDWLSANVLYSTVRLDTFMMEAPPPAPTKG